MNGSRTRLGKKSKSFWKQWTHNSPGPMGHSEGCSKREDHSNTGLPKKDRKISKKQPNSTSTRTGETTTKAAQNKYKEGNKIRAELNDIH